MDLIQKHKKIIILLLILLLIPVIAAVSTIELPLLKKTAEPTEAPKLVQIQAPQINPKPASLQKGPFRCPSIASFCKIGKDILKNGKYVGFGTTIATGSAILAAFDGEITGGVTTLPPEFGNEKIVTLLLDNNERGLRGLYYYQGDDPPTGFFQVKSGEEIDRVGSVMSFYDASLVFALVKNDFFEGEKDQLTSKDFMVP